MYHPQKQQHGESSNSSSSITLANVIPAMLPPLHTNSVGNTPPKTYYPSTNCTTTNTNTTCN